MKENTPTPRFQLIPISQIEPDPQQPRKDLDLAPMVSSIKQFGIKNPITVRQHGDKFIIIAGERRFRACTELKFSEVPAYIDGSGVDPANTRMVLEMHRKDFTAVEEAELFKHVQDVNKFSNQQLADWSHKSKSHISGILKVAALPEAEKKKVRRAELSTRAAIKIAQKAAEERQEEFRRLLAPGKKAKETPTLSAMLTGRKVVTYQTREIEHLKRKLLAAPEPKNIDEWQKTELILQQQIKEIFMLREEILELYYVFVEKVLKNSKGISDESNNWLARLRIRMKARRKRRVK